MNAQQQVLRLYYEINEVMSGLNMMRLDSLVASGSINSYSIVGYADYLSSDGYNKELSERRAMAVKQYLWKRHQVKPSSIVACEGRGESASRDQGKERGEASQRKVEVWYSRGSMSAKNNAPAKGETFEIKGLSFVPGRHTVSPSSTGVMRQLLQTMTEHPTLRIEIQGHICCVEDQEDGFDYDSGDRHLSTNRAKAIYDFLVYNGIDSTRMTYKGFGHRKPLVKEKTEADEQINRRVEIKVLDK